MSRPKTYPLLPFSRLVYDMTRWMPDVYSFPFTFCWHGAAKHKQQVEDAIRQAIANHPVFEMKTDWRGQHYPAPLRDNLHGQYHDIRLYTDDDDLYIHSRASRILGDGESGRIFLEDVLHAYQGEPLAKDDYWGYLEYVEQQKQSKHYADSKAWLESEFSDLSIPVHPNLDRHLWTLLPPKPGLYKTDYSDLQDKINQLAETEFLSMDGFFSLCAGLAIAEYCGTDAVALTWAYEGREREEEQRIFGSLHRDIPFLIRKSKIENRKSELIREARNQIRSGIAHSDYPYTLTAPYNQRWNYAVNVLRIPEPEAIMSLLPKELELLPPPEQKIAYALLDVEIHETQEKLFLCYRYSATRYKESSIQRFAGLVRKYAEWLLEED